MLSKQARAHEASVLLDDEASISLLAQMFQRGMRPLIREYIEESHGRDIRVIVVRGRVVAVWKERLVVLNSDQLSPWGIRRGNQVDSGSESVAIRAANELGLDVAGVDMLDSLLDPRA